MEKLQKAIEVLKGVEFTIGNANVLKEPLKLAVEALEKQMPIKVPIEYDDEFTCPVCGKTTEDYDVTTLKVCPECGQKLSWD